MIRILLADDHAIVRLILCQLIEQANDMQVIAMAANGEQAVSEAIARCPDVAVLDISMPIMDGIEAARQICSKCPGIHALMVSTYNTPHHIHRSIEAGAWGYILKDSVKRDLVIALRSVYQGDRYFSKQIARVANLYIDQ